MAVSGISAYNDALYQWQGQQLKSTGNSATSKTSTALSSLFGGTQSMTSQISSMVELTKYAMDAMGVTGDSRVTFSQITRYREQLQKEFSEGVKKGLTQSGISDLSGLSFSLDAKGAISVSGANANDRKAAQAWLDANPSYGESLRKSLDKAGAAVGEEIKFNISSSGKITLIDETTLSMQDFLDQNGDLSSALRSGLENAGINFSKAVELRFSEDGALIAAGDSPDAEKINAWLKEHTDFADSLKKQLDKKNIDTSAVSLRLGTQGNAQIHVNNADNNDVQAILDKSGDIGQKIIAGLGNLGIDPDISFTLKIDDDGNVQVITDHPDKDKLQKFFDENPDLIKKYRQIETLAGIDDARKAMQISPSAMRKRIQIESMAAWWMGSSDANSYFGQYDSGSLSLLAGLNMKI